MDWIGDDRNNVLSWKYVILANADGYMWWIESGIDDDELGNDILVIGDIIFVIIYQF